ncbi:hypothetical protein U9M48_035462 [Paspalum notatum var. saurae]|uniref:Uncharacterized protein n=1 Tax=Paspalum notatum var. saurae TaxID=547442 RepID=A0AAQ3UFG3_PASNO
MGGGDDGLRAIDRETASEAFGRRLEEDLTVRAHRSESVGGKGERAARTGPLPGKLAGPAQAGVRAGRSGGLAAGLSARHMVASESFTELSRGETFSVLRSVRFPPVYSSTSKLSCCIQDPPLIIALRNVKLSLHCTEPVICLKRISRMGESRRMSLHKVSTPVPLLRLRIGLNILQSLYCIVESSHHLHLKLKRLICCQRRWVLRWVLRWVAISLIPGVYHLLAAVETISVSNCCTYPE